MTTATAVDYLEMRIAKVVGLNTPAALAVRVADSVRVALGPDGVGAIVTRPAPGQAGPALSTPGPPAGGGPRER
jgi:hypothetical protein